MAPIDLSVRAHPLPGPRRHPVRLAASAFALVSASAVGAEWSIHPNVGLRETYTDNVALTPRGVSSWITEAIPAVSVSAASRRFTMNANYEFHYLRYSDELTPSRIAHLGNANANLELLDDLLFADAAANIDQQRISPFGRQSIDIGNDTGNRAEVRTYSLSPYLRHRFGDVASAEVRYTVQRSKSTTDLLADANTHRVLLDVNSVPEPSGWGWGIQVDRQRIDYSNAPPFDLARYTGKYRYMLTPRLALEASAGYEDNNYIALAETPRGAMWNLGFAWNPSELTAISAHAGHRYFGSTFDLSASHRANLATWTVSYSEDVVTQAQAPASTTLDTAGFLDQLWKNTVPDDAARKTVVDTFIRNARLPATLTGDIYGLSNRVFLQKYLPVAVALTGVRNTVTFRLYGIRREPLSVPVGTPVVPPSGLPTTDDDYLQLGASAVWDWQLSPRSHVIAGSEYARIRSFVGERIDYERSVRAAMSTRLTARSTASLEVRRQQRASRQADVDYVENAVSLFILLQL